MSSDDKINQYIKSLSKELRSFSAAERDDITKEIRSHLTERQQQDSLEEALVSLGSPQEYAQNLFASMEVPAPSPKFDILGAIKNTSLAFLKNVALLIAIVLLIGAGMEISNPNQVGLWFTEGDNSFYFGRYLGSDPKVHDPLGNFFLPITLIGAALFGAAFWVMRKMQSAR